MEVSFNHYGDRGRVDVLAYHAPTGCVLVAEVKSAVGDVQETLGRIDVKVRLGRSLAASAGWIRRAGGGAGVDRHGIAHARRVIAAHPVLFARFNMRGRAAQTWLRRPTLPPPSGLLWFVDVARCSSVCAPRAVSGHDLTNRRLVHHLMRI